MRHVKCHNDIARPEIADGGEGLWIWRVATSSILGKDLRKAGRG